MTIEQAIEHALDVATIQESCSECAKEHLQLANWLTDYVKLKAELAELKEKQVAKKPIEDFVLDENPITLKTFDRKIYVCPSCENIYLKPNQQICNECKQFIDWSEEDE